MQAMMVRLKYILPLKSLISLIVLLFLILLPIVCWNLQYSSYFLEGNFNYESYKKRQENNKRLAVARSKISKAKNLKLFPYDYNKLLSKVKPTEIKDGISFLIIASNRDLRKIDAYQPKYLTQTMSHLFESIKRDMKYFGKRWKYIGIDMCNADRNPSKFSELLYLAQFFDNIELPLLLLEKNPNQCHSIYTFLACLQKVVSRSKLNNFVVIEDDMLINTDGIDGLSSLFNGLTKRFHENMSKKLGFIQLYYPLYQVKFSIIDAVSLLEILLLSSSLVFILLVIYFRVHIRPLLFWHNFMVISILFIICLLVVLFIGRPHWRNAYHSFVRSYSLIDPLVTPINGAAVLLDRNFINLLLSDNNPSNACDSNNLHLTKQQILEKTAKKYKRRILSSNMNLFKHVGLYSNIQQKAISPHIID